MDIEISPGWWRLHQAGEDCTSLVENARFTSAWWKTCIFYQAGVITPDSGARLKILQKCMFYPSPTESTLTFKVEFSSEVRRASYRYCTVIMYVFWMRQDIFITLYVFVATNKIFLLFNTAWLKKGSDNPRIYFYATVLPHTAVENSQSWPTTIWCAEWLLEVVAYHRLNRWFFIFVSDCDNKLVFIESAVSRMKKSNLETTLSHERNYVDWLVHYAL